MLVLDPSFAIKIAIFFSFAGYLKEKKKKKEETRLRGDLREDLCNVFIGESFSMIFF